MKFDYKKLSTGHIRPIIPIELKRIKYFVLVDSGSDLNIFHAEVGEALGIDIKSGEKQLVTGVVKGKLQAYYVHNVSIVVAGHQFEVRAGFMPKLSKYGFGIAGQYGFFDLFRNIKFEKRKDRLELNQ